jgi:hypothetical protein
MNMAATLPSTATRTSMSVMEIVLTEYSHPNGDVLAPH